MPQPVPAPPADAVYLTFNELASILRLGPVRTTQMLRAGTFPRAFKTGDSQSSEWRIPRADLESYIADRVAKTHAQRAPDAA